jgi:outer membrane protein TolC
MATKVFAAPEVAPARSADLTLGQCIQLGLKYNTPVRLAQTQLEQAEGKKIEFMSRFYPSGQIQAITLPALASFQITQPIISPKLMPTKRATDAFISAAEINVQLTLNEYVFELRRLFAQALNAQKQTQLQREYYQLLERRMLAMNHMFDAQKITKTELVQLQVRFNLVGEELSSLQIQEEQKRMDLFQWIGLNADDYRTAQRLVGDFVEDIPEEKPLEELTILARQQRLDYQLLQKVVEGSEAQVRVAAADYYPTLAAGAGATLQIWKPLFLDANKRQDDDGKTVDDSTFSTGLYLSWRLFDGGETLGEKIAAQTEAKSKKVLLDEISRDIPQQMKVALETLKASYQSVVLLNQNEQASEESLKSARIQFDRGKIIQLELMSAEQEHYLLKRTRLNALYRMEQARINYMRAIGENVQFLVPAPVISSTR